MDKDLSRLLDQSIRLEHNMAALYLIFYDAFPKDSGFWWSLAMEEKNHAALLKSGRQYFLEDGLFPPEIVDTTVESLVQANSELERLLEEQKENPLSRETAFNFAAGLEESAGEIHFQRAMEKQPDSEAIKLFIHLNKDDKDHYNRIRTYMKAKGIGQI